jgi:RimJ/RimL family protein N-acetyltransferase
LTETLTLRDAVPADAYALWLWANDPESRAAAHDRPLIPWREHVAWLARQLESGDACVWIGELGGQPAGSIRFDTPDTWRRARLSYVIAAENRGHGLGRVIVVAGLARLRALHPRTLVWADVRRSNERSARVFARLDWRREEPDAESYRFWADER